MNFIQVQNLTKKIPTGFKNSNSILKGLSFQVRMNRITGFIGVNGAGKSTTLKCILGLMKVDAGQVQIFGEPGWSLERQKRIGYLPERPHFHDFLTAKQFLSLHYDLSGLPREGFELAAEKVLILVGLKDKASSRLKTFSKGMLQRIGVAQALVHSPECIIFDEPMSGLDPDGRWMMKDIFLNMKKSGKTIFFSSHLLNDMEGLCDDLVVIDQGKLLFQGELSQFKSHNSLEESFQDIRRKCLAPL